MEKQSHTLSEREATGTHDRYARLRELAEEAFRQKEKRRKELAALPIEEKVRILVKLQQRCNEVRRATGRPELFAWQLDDSEKQ
ncbi:MAG TPA: hypothetical protein VNT99_01925 [Methylomirabilota bacterium]|nr:hypothetical protein [Methylomirabilota bacterium]